MRLGLYQNQAAQNTCELLNQLVDSFYNYEQALTKLKERF